MSTFKKILESKSEISQKDMKRLQRAAAAKTPEQAKEILKNLESTQERASRTTRRVPSAKSPSTVEQTPLNKYIRGEAEKGRGVSQELRDTAGIDDAERRGYIKPEKAGETKPAQGATRRARARGAAARQGVDVSAEPPKTPRRNVRLGNVTRGGPVRVTTLKPTKPAPAPKPEAIKQASLSKRQAAYRASEASRLKREADKVISSLRSKRDISARMSRGIDDIERLKSLRSRAAQQVDLAKTTRARTAPGPQPSAAQLTKFTTGQEKGYIGKSGAPTTKGIQTYTTRRATKGFGDAGYDAAKRGVKDPLGAAKSVDNIVSRAASGDKVARSEVRRTYKTMTSRYKDIVPSSQRTKVGLASLNKPVTAPPKVEAPISTPAKPKVELPKTSSPSSGTGGSATTTTLAKTKTKPAELKLGTPTAKPTATSKVPTNASAVVPEKEFSDFTMRQMSGKSNQTYQYKQQKQPAPTEPPKPYQSTPTKSPTKSPDPKPTPRPTPTPKPAPAPAPDPAPAPTKQRRSLNATSKRSGTAPTSVKPTLTSAQQKKVTQRILKTAKPQLGKRLATRTVPDLAKKVTTQAATKTATKLTPGRVLGGAIGAGFDVVQGREDAKKAGASDRRAWLRGAARAVGGLAGGSLGALAGGGFGSFALGTAGYMAGSQVGDKLFTSLAGGTQKQKDWLKQRNLATQAGTKAKDVQYRKGNQAVVFDKRVGKERIGTWDPKSQTYKANMTNPTKAYTAKNPFERLGRQFARSNEGSGLFGMGVVKGYGLADMAKRYYAGKDEAARRKRVSDFKSTATR